MCFGQILKFVRNFNLKDAKLLQEVERMKVGYSIYGRHSGVSGLYNTEDGCVKFQ